MKRAIFIFLILFLLVIAGCVNKESQESKEYEKCTSVCSSVLSEDFVTLELCRQECKKKFLEEK